MDTVGYTLPVSPESHDRAEIRLVVPRLRPVSSRIRRIQYSTSLKSTSSSTSSFVRVLVRRARSNKLAIRTNSPRDSNTPRELAHRTRALNTRFDERTALSSPLRQGRLPRCAARMRFRTGFEPAKSDQALKVRVAIEEAANKEGLLSKKLRFERSKVFSDSVGTLPGSFGALKSGWSFSLCQCKPSARDLQKIAHLSTERHSCLSQRSLQTMTLFCSDAQFPCSLFPCFF